MRLKLIACEISIASCVPRWRGGRQVDLEFLPKGLHDISQAGMSRRLRCWQVDESRYRQSCWAMGYATTGWWA